MIDREGGVRERKRERKRKREIQDKLSKPKSAFRNISVFIFPPN